MSKAGTFGKRVVAPTDAEEDAFAPDSYWWLFRRLTDKVKGDPIKSIPGCYERNNRIVRARFDALERSFVQQLVPVLAQAAERRESEEGDAEHILDEFSYQCVSRVMDVLGELLVELA